MSTHNDHYQYQHFGEVSYDTTRVDGSAELTADDELLDNLTDWQLEALARSDLAGQHCLIHSWWNSPFSGKSC